MADRTAAQGKKKSFVRFNDAELRVDPATGNPVLPLQEIGGNVLGPNQDKYTTTYTVADLGGGLNRAFARGRARIELIMTKIVLPIALAVGVAVGAAGYHGHGPAASFFGGNQPTASNSQVSPGIMALADRFLSGQMTFEEFMTLSETQMQQLFYFIFQGGKIGPEGVQGILERMANTDEQARMLNEAVNNHFGETLEDGVHGGLPNSSDTGAVAPEGSVIGGGGATNNQATSGAVIGGTNQGSTDAIAPAGSVIGGGGATNEQATSGAVIGGTNQGSTDAIAPAGSVIGGGGAVNQAPAGGIIGEDASQDDVDADGVAPEGTIIGGTLAPLVGLKDKRKNFLFSLLRKGASKE